MEEVIGLPSNDWKPKNIKQFNKVVRGEMSPIVYAKNVNETHKPSESLIELLWENSC